MRRERDGGGKGQKAEGYWENQQTATLSKPAVKSGQRHKTVTLFLLTSG